MGLLIKLTGQELYLDEQVGFLLAGRSANNDLILNTGCISRQHLRFECRNNHYYVIDESQNGSFIYHRDQTYCYINQERYELNSNVVAICLGKPIDECSEDEIISIDFTTCQNVVIERVNRELPHHDSDPENTILVESLANVPGAREFAEYDALLLNYLLFKSETIIVVLDENFLIKYHSPGWGRLFPNRLGRFQGNDILTFINQQERQEFFDTLNQCLLDGSQISVDTLLQIHKENVTRYPIEIVPNKKINLPINGITLIIKTNVDDKHRSNFLASRYEIAQLLSQSNFAKTYLGYDYGRPGHPKCIIKQLRISDFDPKVSHIARRLFYHEALSLEKLGRHDQIPLLLGYLEREGEFFLVQDFIEGDNLAQILKNESWTEQEALNFLRQMLNILIYVHEQHVIHRDIKPDNIIRRTLDGKYVLIDFGSVKLLPNSVLVATKQTATTQNMTVPVGTPGYMPLEQKLGYVKTASDLYPLGVIAIEALTRQKYTSIQSNWHKMISCHPQLIKILSRLVAENIEDRYANASLAIQDVIALMNNLK